MINSMVILKIFVEALKVVFGIMIIEYAISEIIHDLFGIDSHILALSIVILITTTCYFLIWC